MGIIHGIHARITIQCIAVLVLTIAAGPLAAQQRGSTAFIGVNVIPMDTERVVANQTVVVQAGRIIAAGPAASTAVPANAVRVDTCCVRPLKAGATNVAGRIANTDPTAARLEAHLRLLMLKALSDAGVEILLGTDAPQIFSVPGFSLDREVVSMASAGMTPYQILHSGTTAVASHFGWTDTGTIEVGKRADLVLLDANPLTDIGNISKRAGVMVNGRWLSRQDIERRLDEIAARAAG